MEIDDWEQREVCPDGSCTGVIGAEGNCSICGRSPEASADREATANPACCDNVSAPAETDKSLDEPADSWNQRRLCSDGACVGVIGDNDRCAVCGKVA
jgi:hypothetical protein